MQSKQQAQGMHSKPGSQNPLSQNQLDLLEAAVNGHLKELQEKTGMQTIQKQFEEEAKKSREEQIFFFNRFHSFLRYFNANTPTNCFKSGIITPALNFLGQIFNFANDHDCELVSELFTATKNNPTARSAGTLLAQGDTWLALGKVILSSLGALIRGVTTLIDFVLDAIFSPIRTTKNFWAAITDPKHFFKHINRHYQLSTTEANPLIPNAGSDKISVKMLTLNVGMLRSWFWDLMKDTDGQGKPIQFNKLKPPKDRIQDLINDLVARAKDRDVICLQEMFDNLAYLGFGKDTQQMLIDALKPHFPHAVYDIGHRSWPFVDSGLIVFSKHPIVDVDYFRYPNLMGVDSLSNKGCVGVKIQMGDRFITVYNTHTQAGIGGLTQWMEYLGRKRRPGGSGDYRDEEFGFINEHIQQWASTPPPSAAHLKYLDSYLMGDLNQGLNNFNKVYAISHGKKPMGVLGERVAGKIKYPGQNQLMHHFNIHLPDNFVDCRSHESSKKGTDPDRKTTLKKVKGDQIKVIVAELKKSPEFDGIDEEQLRKEVKQRFLIYTGSIINPKYLIEGLQPLDEPTRAQDEDDFEGEKMVDALFSSRNKVDLESSGLYRLDPHCLIFSTRGKGNTFYSDHGGLTCDFTYTTKPPTN